MTDPRDRGLDPERRLRRPLALTRLGMTAERLARAFWPAWTVALLALAALMMGAHEALAVEAVWALGLAAGLGLAAALGWGGWRFRMPSRAEARERLDATLPGRPIAALADRDAVGGHDPASRAIWAAHQSRMARLAARARAVPADLRLADRDPYALRYAALTALAVAVLFGSLLRAASVTDALPGAPGAAMASGPAWEGWVEPPAYTGRPSLYLADQPAGEIEVPVGSRLTLRLYGEVGRLAVAETVSGRDAPAAATDPQQSFEVARSGRLAVEGPGGAAWTLIATPDAAPSVEAAGEPERSPLGETQLPFAASDDHGVTGGSATIALDLPAVDRRHGLAAEPEPREAIVVDLPLPITGDRSEFEEVLVADLSQHPFAGLPVTITLRATDAPGQESAPATLSAELPGRAFFDPLARAVVEQRRDLLWSRANAGRVAQILRAVSHRPEDVFDEQTTYLRLRLALRRLEAHAGREIPDEARDEVAQMLWDVAVLLEEGRLSDALERMRQAQERLSEAMREGATEAEIAELMQELRDATREYMRQLAQEGADPSDQDFAQGESQTITQDQLQQMMDRIQELMEQGRMAEAQELLEELQRMMENMQVVEGQPGQGGEPSPGEQSMQDLQDTLRDQQELSDEAFRDLQEGQPGQPQQGQPGQPGQQQPGQQPGEGQPGQQPGQGQQGQERADGQGQQPGEQPGGEGSLADRQEALRDQLGRQRGMLPGDGSEARERAADALDRAEGAMDGAEQALREGDIPQALDDQADAMEALREGMRALGDQLAGEPQEGGQQGQQMGEGSPEARDPLGREAGSRGRIGTGEDLLQGEDVYRRAQDLLDELRRRSADRTRPEDERRYYDRLLDRF